MVSITLTAIVDGQGIDAADVTVPLQELEDAINDLIDGTVAFTLIDVNGGSIDGTMIGANSASTGAFTTLTATDGSGVAQLNGSNIASGTVAAARIGVLPASKITSGTLDVARIPFDAPGPIGGATPSTAEFTDVTADNVTAETLRADDPGAYVWIGEGDPSTGDGFRLMWDTSVSDRLILQYFSGGVGGATWQYAATATVIYPGSVFPANAGTQSFGLASLRWGKIWVVDIDSTNAVNVSSDARFKRDIRAITPDRGLSLMLALKPRTFKRVDSNRTEMGFVAQEMESALRRGGHDGMSVVKTDAETGEKSIAYTEIIAAQAAAIQALEARISKLERMVQ